MNPKKAPIPFEHIAIAVAFSPSLNDIISEAIKIASIFNSKLYFIHIGSAEEKLSELEDSIKLTSSIDISYEIIIKEDNDIVDGLLKICKEYNIDLLIAGALEKESTLKYFIGSVSRKICRKAKCSVLILKEPSNNPKHYDNIVINCLSNNRKTIPTIETALYFAHKIKSQMVHLINETQIPGLITILNKDNSQPESEMIESELFKQEHEIINDILAKINNEYNVTINPMIINSKPGLGVSNFARYNEADLLVMNSPDTQFGLIDRIFPHDLECSLVNLPCSLLIVHSRE